MDAVLEYLREHDIPETRQNYLELAFMGQVPDTLDAEQEAALPEQFQNNAE